MGKNIDYAQLAIGSRLRRLSDTLFDSVDKIYNSRGFDFKSRQFAAICHLQRKEGSSIQDLAEALRATHPAAIQMVRQLSDLKLVTVRKDKSDARKTRVTLSKAGQELVRKLSPCWLEIQGALNAVLESVAPKFLEDLSRLEKELEASPLDRRLAQARQPLSKKEVEIIEWDPAYKQSFYDLNAEWINAYFSLEEKDRQILREPEKYILADGGMILFLKWGSLVIGTCALIRDGRGFELGKMAISPLFQGKGFGKILLDAAINWAKASKAAFISLETASILEKAISMYSSAGFKRLKHPLGSSAYKRADVYMRLDLR